MKAHSQWEIERKFIVKNLPEGLIEPRKCAPVRQGYLLNGDDREMRVRDKAGTYTMTIKQGSGLKRLETEIELTEQQFETLWPLTQGFRVEKCRYKIPYFSHVLDLDVFSGALSPLIMVEVEFESEEESRNFVPPDFAVEDVTIDAAYKNVNLALKGLPNKKISG